MKIVNKKNIYMLSLFVICLLMFVIVPTYAKFGNSYVTGSDIAGLALNFDVSISNIEEYEEVIVPAGDTYKFNIEITNNSESIAYYGVWYRMVEPSDKPSDILIGRLKGTEVTTSGEIASDGVVTVTAVIINNSSSQVIIDIGVASSTTGTSDIEYLSGKRLITGDIEEEVKANAPNLDNNNLIPVYFDETEGTYGSWMKADSANVNNSWYDYENKMWANAVIVDPTKKSTYQAADIGDPITDTDIIAFYVWIPRYKYRVWNITRQGGDESTYAYPAYSTGIEINWENGTSSTGNVECTYNIESAESATNLSDTCIYNSTDTITTTSLNTNYTDAWYTHPAFTFGDGTDKEKTGFWIGKFETSTTEDSTCYTTPDPTNCNNTNQTPRILPDVSSLRNQAVSTQFMTAVKFQDYLSNAVDAHMLTNLEWGAVTYLMHSNYGLCNGISCQGIYINNSYGTSCYFTGRSGGAIAGSTDLNLANAYPNDSTSTTKYNCNGYYDYKGYKLDYNTGEPTSKDITKVASTTGNITGVYDMSGGAYEYVMGNMVDSSYAFYPSYAETSWNGTSWYDTTNNALYSKYYNAYSYGTNYENVSAFNRARLGDATAEVLGSSTSSNGSWKVGSGITGSNSYFVFSSHSWFSRGGSPGDTGSGPFNFLDSFGDSGNDLYSFRSSIS